MVEEKRTNKHGLGLAPSARRKKFVTLLYSFLCIYELSWACIRSKFPHSHQECWLIFSRWPTRPLGQQVLAVAFLWPSASTDFCGLLSPADCPVLFFAFLSSLSLGPCLPSFSSSLVGNLAHKPFVWVLRQTDKGILWLALTHTHTHRNECPTSCHTQLYGFNYSNLILIIILFSSNYFYQIIVICLHTVVWFQPLINNYNFK